MTELYNYIKERSSLLPELDYSQPLMVGQLTYLNTIANDIFDDSLIGPVTKTESNILFCTYIAPRYKYWLVGDEFMRQFLNVLSRSYDEFKTLIDLYEDEKENLMNGIKVSVDSRFNDTPQDQGDFNDDEHATTITHNESTTDGATVIERLTEIKQKLEDIYERWAREFKDLFTPSY